MSKSLIQRLRERIQTQPSLHGVANPTIRHRRPVTELEMAKAETRLGFSLPLLVRNLYMQVADGGYGPGNGVIELDGHDYTLVESRLRMNEETEPDWMWPPRFVQFVSWGCHYVSGIDCAHSCCPVIFYDHDLAVGDATLSDCLFPEADSLEEWLEAWLNGENLSERRECRRTNR